MSHTKIDRELSEQTKNDLGAIRQRVTDLESDLIDKLVARIQDLHLELMYLKDAAVAVQELRRMRQR
jgi:hypothetical protein